MADLGHVAVDIAVVSRSDGRVVVGGVDLTSQVRSFKVEWEPGERPVVTLEVWASYDLIARLGDARVVPVLANRS